MSFAVEPDTQELGTRHVKQVWFCGGKRVSRNDDSRPLAPFRFRTERGDEEIYLLHAGGSSEKLPCVNILRARGYSGTAEILWPPRLQEQKRLQFIAVLHSY